jgi:hypothetical protein
MFMISDRRYKRTYRDHHSCRSYLWRGNQRDDVMSQAAAPPTQQLLDLDTCDVTRVIWKLKAQIVMNEPEVLRCAYSS